MEEVSDEIAELEEGEYFPLVDAEGCPHDDLVFGGHIDLPDAGEIERAATHHGMPTEILEKELRDFPDCIRHTHACMVESDHWAMEWELQECSEDEGYPVTIVK